MEEIIIPTEVLDFLTLCYATSATNQRAKGVTFNLTFDDYIGVLRLHPRALDSVIRRYMARRAKGPIMRGFRTAYVLSWVSREAKAAGVMNAETAKFMSHFESLEIFKLKKGEKHTEESCLLIRNARLGKQHDEATRRKMSESRTGLRKSEASKQKARETALRNAAAKRATTLPGALL